MQPCAWPVRSGSGEVQEGEGPVACDQVAARRRTSRSWSSSARKRSIAAGPGALVERELLLVENSGRLSPARWTTVKTDVDRVAGGLAARWPGGGRRSRSRRARRRPVDAAAGHHAGVVGQGHGLLVLGAGVERAGPLVEQPVEGRRARRAELRDRVGLSPSTEIASTRSRWARRSPGSTRRRGRDRRGRAERRPGREDAAPTGASEGEESVRTTTSDGEAARERYVT